MPKRTLTADDLKHLPNDMIREISRFHPLLIPPFTNDTLRRAVRDYLAGGERKRRIVTKYGEAAPAPPTEATAPISSEAAAAWPAAARVVETLPAAASSEDACPVCLETLSSKVVALPCGHRLHRRCAAPWLGRRGSCPACRRGVDRALETAARAAAPA